MDAVTEARGEILFGARGNFGAGLDKIEFFFDPLATRVLGNLAARFLHQDSFLIPCIFVWPVFWSRPTGLVSVQKVRLFVQKA